MLGRGRKRVLSSCLHLLSIWEIRARVSHPLSQHELATEPGMGAAALSCMRSGTVVPCVTPQIRNGRRSGNSKRAPGTVVHLPKDVLQGNREEGPIATHNRNDSCKHIERKKSGGKESTMSFKPRLKKNYNSSIMEEKGFSRWWL